jgi:O-antigen/teichoic acid export membrane protein
VPNPSALPGRRNPVLTNPVFLIFLSSNVGNVGNLAYNVLFSRALGPALFGELSVLMTVTLSVLAILSALQLSLSREVSANAGRVPDKLGALCAGTLIAGALAALVVIPGLIWTGTDRICRRRISLPYSLPPRRLPCRSALRAASLLGG